MKVFLISILSLFLLCYVSVSEDLKIDSPYLPGSVKDDVANLPDYTFTDSRIMQTSRGAPFFQKGFSMEILGDDFLEPGKTKITLQKLKDMGVSCIQLNVNWYQDNTDSIKIRATELTPSDKNLRSLINQARNMGFKVMLKPQISLVDKYNQSFWREDIGFYNDKDWAKWFKEYKKFILHYAKIAAKENVDLFSVGSELSFSTEKIDQWGDVIKDIRNIFKGKLTYAASWENYKSIKFWNKLDYVGINAFFPLSYNASADIEDMKKGWLRWKNDIETWNEKYNRPIIFTQIGYSSSNMAAVEPWKVGSGQEVDLEMQAKCYKAFFDTIWGSQWLAGVYWWKCTPYTNYSGQNNKCFTPINKPAGEIVSAYYNNYKITYSAIKPSMDSLKVKKGFDGKGSDVNLDSGKPSSTLYDVRVKF